MIRVIPTNKFHHVETQFAIVAGRYILLRLSYWDGSGAIKTATAGDDRGPPAYPDPARVTAAMAQSLDDLGGFGDLVVIRHDRKQRVFGDLVEEGSVDDCIKLACIIAGRMSAVLNL